MLLAHLSCGLRARYLGFPEGLFEFRVLDESLLGGVLLFRRNDFFILLGNFTTAQGVQSLADFFSSNILIFGPRVYFALNQLGVRKFTLFFFSMRTGRSVVPFGAGFELLL